MADLLVLSLLLGLSLLLAVLLSGFCRRISGLGHRSVSRTL